MPPNGRTRRSETSSRVSALLTLYRRLFWYFRSRSGFSQVAVSGTHPDAIKMREELERDEERRQRWLRRFRLI